MNRFTDLFISRPVFAVVVNLLIFLAGARALQSLSIGQFPEVSSAIVQVSTVYPGADAELVRGFVTTPLEQAIAEADGIDFIRSTSQRGASVIEAQLRLNYPPNDALSQINTKIASVRGDLPQASEVPTINVRQSATTAAMYITFGSETLNRSQITDYLMRVAQPRMATVPGVQQAGIIGGRPYAMRVWLDPVRMTAQGVTGADVERALERNNFLATVGAIKGRGQSFSVTADTSPDRQEDFADLVIAERDGVQIRLGEVARIELGSENYNRQAYSSGQPAIYLTIEVAPGANLLSTLSAVKDALSDLMAELPAGITTNLNYDASVYVREAIREVATTLLEALGIVVVVIFLFLGSLRATLIPTIAVPLSLVGAGILMLGLGFSLNLLTLLAMVLAIGLVVDDAIIVLENIHRHIENGLTPREAARIGARELAGPVVAMTITLLAVYAPIGFLGGVTGTLFTEFAFTLAATVLISGVVALTLSPVMCARLLEPDDAAGKFSHWLDRRFATLRDAYARTLRFALKGRIVIVALGLATLVGCWSLFRAIPTELAPVEDNGILFYSVQSPPNTSLDQLNQLTKAWMDTILAMPEVRNNFHFNGGVNGQTNVAFGGAGFVPSSQRDRTFAELLPVFQRKSGEVTGLQIAAFNLAPLPGAGDGLPVQFVVTSTQPFEEVRDVAEALVARAWESGLFQYVDSDLKFDNQQIGVEIDRRAAADLGLSMEDIGRELAAYLGDGYVNRFDLSGRAYKVIVQVERDYRINPQQMLELPIRSDNGQMLPLSAVATLQETVQPRQLTKFQQLNAAAVSGIPAPGVALGEALAFLEEEASSLFPNGFSVDYAGPSRLFKAEGSSLVITFFFALVIIYLVLAAQFESFRDPLIMLVSVPLSIFGALVFLAGGFATMNIYTQVGLVTLIGLISKHGILIVQFANQLREEHGYDRKEAVERASAIRLRPVLMTTAAIVLAVLPLVFASGAGAESRRAIGIVIAGGMTIGTVFTLFVVPAVYTYVAHRSAGAKSDHPPVSREASTTGY